MAETGGVTFEGDNHYDGIIVYDEGLPTGSQATHIARYDPARVLLEVDAKRGLIEKYSQSEAMYVNGIASEGIAVGALLVALRALAAAYSDHEEYCQEWAL